MASIPLSEMETGNAEDYIELLAFVGEWLEKGEIEVKSGISYTLIFSTHLQGLT